MRHTIIPDFSPGAYWKAASPWGIVLGPNGAGALFALEHFMGIKVGEEALSERPA